MTATGGGTTETFVGRDGELAELMAGLPDRVGAGARLRLISGEPGIGKTRLARELAAAAEKSGHRVAWGQCWNEAGTPAYWPWTQVVRRLRGLRGGTDLAELVLDDRADLAGSDRFALFDATAAELRRLSERAPIVVILDDLHRSDVPSLQLTRFLLGHLVRTPLLVVATHHPLDFNEGTAVADHFHELSLIGQETALGGLDISAVAELVGDQNAAAVRAVTGGNPLFAQQFVGAAARAASASCVADPARSGPDQALVDVLQARLTSLEPDAFELLAALAVLGPGAADPPTVASLVGRSPTALAPLIRRLRRSGLIEPRSLNLTHPLIAETVTAITSADRLAALHLAAAERASDVSAARRAHHLLRAGADHWEAAVDACREAADAATGSFAHGDAIGHLTRALELLDAHPEALAVRFRIAFALAAAQERTSGMLAAEDSYRMALDAARRMGDARLVATAAARHGIAFYADGAAQQARAADCRDSLATLPQSDSAVRARLVANLAAADPNDPDQARHAAEAVAIALRVGDPEALGIALVAEQLTDLGPSTLERRLRSSREIIALAEASESPELAVRGRFLLKNALLEAGDMRELDAALLTQDRQVAELAEGRFARHALWFRCMRAMLDGRAGTTETLAQQCLEIAQRLQDPDAFGVYIAQHGVALWMQGRIGELEPIYLDLMRAEPHEPLWPTILAWIAVGDGRLDTARGLLEQLPPPSELPQGMHTLLNLYTMADAAVAVGDDDLVAKLRDLMLPYADRAVPIAMGAACFGVIARPLGQLAARLGRVDEAIAHFERAISVAARMGARPWLAEAQLALAETLINAGRGDDPRIATLAAEAKATISAIGLPMVIPQLERVLNATHSEIESSAGTTVDEPGDPSVGPARIAVLGTFDVRSVDGSTPRWTSRKARALLKILVARRGMPIARDEMMDLLWPHEHPVRLANRLAVAVSTARRALDPMRTLPVEALIRNDSGSLRLVMRNVGVDAETFLHAAESALAAHRADRADAPQLLTEALDAYAGEAFPDEPYERWAEPLRAATSSHYAAVLRAVATRASAAGDQLLRAEALRRLLDVDPYDEQAHLGLIDALRSLGAHGQALAARSRYEADMAEIGIQPTRSH